MIELQRIMQIEDDLAVQEVVRVSLEIIGGFTLLSCSSGADALAQLEAYDPQLILLDVTMPDLDGPATLSQLRRVPAFQHTPVVFLATRAQEPGAKQYYLLGAAGVIIKPFDPMTLADRLRAMWAQLQA